MNLPRPTRPLTDKGAQCKLTGALNNTPARDAGEQRDIVEQDGLASDQFFVGHDETTEV
jgi:hypothetical protein